jgi:hypothetical protein
MPKPQLCGPVECHDAALTRNPTSRSSVRRDVRLFDHAAPDLRLVLDEGCGLSGRAAGGVQIDLGELVLHVRAVEHIVDRLVELGDDRRRGLRRRGDGVPGA